MREVSMAEHNEHMAGFTVVDFTHSGKCPECLDSARSAVTTARVTGSVGATYTLDSTRVGGQIHSATVRRR